MTAKVSSGRAFASGYFPPEYGHKTVSCSYTPEKQAIIGEVEGDWFPSQWKAACEPSFFALADSTDRNDFKLRFSYLPSFDHSIFITVQSEKRGLVLIAKQLTGAGGYEPGVIGRSKELTLSTAQASQLHDLLNKGGLFSEPPDNCDLGIDGTEWIFELVQDGHYRMVKRWSPRGGAERELGDWLLQASGWTIQHN